LKGVISGHLSPLLKLTYECKLDVENDENISSGLVMTKARCWNNFVGFICLEDCQRRLNHKILEWDSLSVCLETYDRDKIHQLFSNLIDSLIILFHFDYAKYCLASLEKVEISGIKTLTSMVTTAVGMNSLLNSESILAAVKRALTIHILRYIHLMSLVVVKRCLN